MATSIKLDAFRDFELEETPEGVDFKTVDGVEEINQAAVTRLLIREGEDPHFPDVGLDIRSMIGPLNRAAVATEIKRELLNVDGIESVDRVDVDFASLIGRRVRATIVYTTEDGETGNATLTGGG